MNKRFKKVIAVVCAIAMVVGTMSVGNVAKADIYSPDTTEWTGWHVYGNTITANGTDGYTVTDMSLGTTWWNIQTWLPSVNFTKGYTYECSFKLTTSAPKTFKVDNRSNDAAVFTETSTDGWVDNGDGTYSYNYTGTTSEITSTSQIDVRVSFGYFDDGTEQEGWAANDTITLTLSDFSITREATGETEADPTTAGEDEDGYTQLKDGTDTQVGEWTLYAGTWAGGQMSYKGSTNDLALKVLASNNNPGCWGLQAKRAASVYSGLTAGTEYTATVSFDSTAAGKMFIKLEGYNEGTTYDVVEGANSIDIDMTYAANFGALVLELSGIPAGTEITNIGFTFTEKTAEETTTAAEETTAEVTTAATEETTAEEVTTGSTGDDPYASLSWTQVGTKDYYVAAANDEFPFQMIEDQGTQMLIIPQVAAGNVPIWPDFTNATLNGAEFSQPAGAGIYLLYSDLTDNAYNVFQATSAVDSHTFQIIIKAGNPGGSSEEETTTVEEQTTDEETTTIEEQTTEATKPEAPAGLTWAGNDDLPYYFAWAPVESAVSYNFYVNGEVVGTSTGAAYNADAAVFETAGDYEVGVSAVNAAGMESDVTTITYTVSGAVTTYSVTVDEVEIASVEAGEVVTLPATATYGYFDGTNMYKAGATVTVNSDMAFTSVNEVSVSVARGAGIKVDGNGTSGIRFQATVASDNMTAVNSGAITEGMLITAEDIYSEVGGSVLTVDSTYTFKDIVNSGWYQEQVGTYCGSIVNIAESNYIRKFIARAYVTITYGDGTSTTIYSGMTGARSIQQVAAAVAAAGYPGVESYKSIIDTFAAAK